MNGFVDRFEEIGDICLIHLEKKGAPTEVDTFPFLKKFAIAKLVAELHRAGIFCSLFSSWKIRFLISYLHTLISMTFYDRAGHKMFDTNPFTRAIFKAIRSQTSMEGKHLMKFFFFFFFFCGTKRRTSSHDGGVPCCVEFRFFFLILNFYFLLFFFGASSSPRRGRHTGGGRNWKWKSSAEWNHRQRRNASSKVVSAGAEEFPSSVPRISTTLPGDWNRVLPACAETASLIEFRGLSQSFIVSAQVYLVFLLWHYWFDQVPFGFTEFHGLS